MSCLFVVMGIGGSQGLMSAIKAAQYVRVSREYLSHASCSYIDYDVEIRFICLFIFKFP